MPTFSKIPLRENPVTENPGNSRNPLRDNPGISRKFPENRNRRINFSEINEIALRAFPELLAKWLPDGSVRNGEWVALNPTRNDRTPGSFMINIRSGKWADFATGDSGGDVVSLVAYLSRCSQSEAARQLAGYLGVGHA